jgi:hypothetical protein
MTGRGVVQVIFACLVLSFVAQAALSRLRLPRTRETAWPWRRQAIERSLSKNGEHLILVEYGPRHIPDKNGSTTAPTSMPRRSSGRAR